MIKYGLKILLMTILLTFFLNCQRLAEPDDLEILVLINGEMVDPVGPVPVENDTALFPAQTLAEKIGLRGVFLEREEKLILWNDRNTILISVNSSTAYVNAHPVSLQAPARMIEKKLMLPLRFTVESAGATISWAKETRTAYVQSEAEGDSPGIEIISSGPLNIKDLKDKNTEGGRLRLPLTAFVYGDLCNINNKKSTLHSIDTLKRFPYMICGDPGTLGADDKRVTDAIKGKVKIFGYVGMGGNTLPETARLKSDIDKIAAAGWYGVFLDQYGYDFNETRLRQNEIVDYIHGKGLACFANGWFIDDVLGSSTDNSFNPGGAGTHLGRGDWVLLESFLTDGSGYRADIGELMDKYIKAQKYRENLEVKIVCLSYRGKGIEDTSSQAALSYLVALALGFDGWWMVDALENNEFRYSPDPGLDLGDRLEVKLMKVTPEIYIAKTDKYLIIFSTEKAPPPELLFYPRKALQ